MSYSPQRYANGELVVVIDCSDLDRSADFWCEVLGYVRHGPVAGTYQALTPAGGAGVQLLLQRVDEQKVGKNRLHLDLRCRDFDEEVARVLAAGASLLTDEPVTEHGWRWHVLGDPDGNEFCVAQAPPGHDTE